MLSARVGTRRISRKIPRIALDRRRIARECFPATALPAHALRSTQIERHVAELTRCMRLAAHDLAVYNETNAESFRDADIREAVHGSRRVWLEPQSRHRACDRCTL